MDLASKDIELPTGLCQQKSQDRGESYLRKNQTTEIMSGVEVYLVASQKYRQLKAHSMMGI